MNKMFFNPVQGREATILNQSIQPGFVYFATDSGKIFLDVSDTERIIAGGSGATVLYSSASKVIANTDDSYSIYFNDLDDQDAQPKPGDLVINKDGRFLKVKYYNSETKEINCDLIAVSGTGGGGGGSSSDPTNPKQIEVTYHDLTRIFLKEKMHLYSIDFTPVSKVDKNLDISYTVRNSQNYTTGFGSMQVSSGSKVSLPIGQYIEPDGTYHGVEIRIEGANSIPYTHTINRVKCIDLKISTNKQKFTNEQIFDASVAYHVNIEGAIQKTLHVLVDGQEVSRINSPESESSISKEVIINTQNLLAGVHTITTYLVADGVSSNVVHTDFIYHPLGTADTTYVIITDYPTECMSYENPMVKYWVYNTAYTDNVENNISWMINGVLIDDSIKEKQVMGQSLIWHVAGLSPNIKNVCEVICGGVSRSFEIYCHYSNIFDPHLESVVLMLSSEGRTNNTSLERRKEWSYENKVNGKTYTADLKNFNWGNNGWIYDEKNQKECLRISNGASVEIPLTLFSDEAPTTGGFTFEFEFKPYNLYSYNLLTLSTDTKVDENNKEDDAVTITRQFDHTRSAISYMNVEKNEAIGLCCGTQDAFFRMSDGTHSTIRYINDEIVTITITVNAAKEQICMYVNGVMSGMTAYSRTSSSLPIGANKLIINSDQCDLDLFNIRIYNQALNSSQIVKNYIANTKSLLIYNQNAFNVSDETVKLADLQEYNSENLDNPTVPYMIFKTSAPDILPFNKANDDVICSIEFVNPALDYALRIGEIDENYYKTHAPSFTANNVSINVQGTSSQKYPRKNFKGKFKKAEDWKCRKESITVDGEALIEESTLSTFQINDKIAEKTICWKADYMDSSSCHNTGFASFAQKLYKYHPLDYYENAKNNTTSDKYYQKYRTTLYGFPVLVFHQKSNGSTEFIGRYNFNLDKGADDTLGMTEKTVHPVVKGTFIEENKDGTTSEKPMDYAHVCECWEFANNMGGRCSFRGNPFDYLYDYTHENTDGSVGAYIFTDENGNTSIGKSDLGDDLEVRYHINDKAIEGAWDNLTAPLEDGGEQISSREAFEVLLGGDSEGNNRTGAYAHLEKLFKWLQSCYYAFDMTSSEDREWVIELLGHEPQTDENGNYYDINGIPIDPKFKDLRNARKTEFETYFDKHLNKDYCTVYYILTELLLMYDSRGKNMMLASWGPMEEFQADKDGNFILDANGDKIPGDYIWFPIFYDCDTQLGVNNSGVPSWEYNVEPTTGFNNLNGEKAFSTANSLLWNNFHQSYVVESDYVKNYYRSLRGGSLQISQLNGYYNFDYDITKDYCMKGILPISVFNANQYYKYIAPSIDGYITKIEDNGAPHYRTTSSYFYCLQGTRDLHRTQMLRNRFNYYDSKWMAQDYQPKTGGGSARWRANALEKDKLPPGYPDELTNNLILKIKPALDQYLVAWPDESATYVTPVFVKGGETTTIDLANLFSSPTYQDQLIYIGGYKYIQEFGNVSLLYLSEFEFQEDAQNLVKIEVGNDNPNYKNAKFPASSIFEATKNKPLLKVFDITNIANLASKIELKDSVKLETFKALGSEITGAVFAEGVNLRHLYLPNTITSINLNQAFNLNRILDNGTDLKVRNEETGEFENVEGLYLQDVVKEKDGVKTTNINEINIIGGNLKLYSYDLLNNISEAIDDESQSDDSVNLSINMEQVHWTPYTQLGEGAEYKDTSTYVYANNNYTYSEYTYNAHTWDLDVLNGRIYEYQASPIDAPTSLSLLDKYIDDNATHYTNITTTSNKTLPVLTGEMYVNNDDDSIISEAAIANRYNLAFPQLSIKVKNVENAYRARFISLDNGVETEISTLRFNKAAADIKITPPENSMIPTPPHYDFKGWSTTNPSTVTDINKIEIIKDFSTQTFSQAEEIVFYAIYKKHKYQIRFDSSEDTFEADKYSKTLEVEYGKFLEEPNEVPARTAEESEFGPEKLTKRLAFKGWTTLVDKAGVVATADNLNLVDITSYKADRDYQFYAVFVEEDVYDSHTDYKYFAFERNSTGMTIFSNNNYILRGKITLPTVAPNDVAITEIGKFNNAQLMSHVFFMKENCAYHTVQSGAFKDVEGEFGMNKNLIGVFLPNSITAILEDAFEYETQLKYISENAIEKNYTLPSELTFIGDYAFASGATGPTGILQLTELPNGLAYLGDSAFYRQSEISISKLPDKLSEIGMNVFAWNPKLEIADTNKVSKIGMNAFVSAGTSVAELTLNNSLTSLGANAFFNYGCPSVNGGLTVNNKSNIENISQYFGTNLTTVNKEV